MTALATRPLPTTIGLLRQHYLPPEPSGTAVTRMRAAIARLDDATRRVAAEVDTLDQADRAAVAKLADLALAAGDIDQAVTNLHPANRHIVEHRLNQVRNARTLATHQLDTAERTDPDYVAWVQRCLEVTREWNEAMSGEHYEDRFAQLAAFAETH